MARHPENRDRLPRLLKEMEKARAGRLHENGSRSSEKPGTQTRSDLKGVFMSDFMNGFFRALAMPNSAENLYQAGAALSDWINDQKEKNAAKERFEKSVNVNAPVLRKTAPAAGSGNLAAQAGKRIAFDDIYASGRTGSQAGPAGQKAPDGYEFVDRHQNESDRMLKEIHQGLVDFMNSGNPDPNAAVGNNPIVPRGRHVENPVIDNRRR